MTPGVSALSTRSSSRTASASVTIRTGPVLPKGCAGSCRMRIFPTSFRLAQVAPGIAEALIATAMGLFAAIPAVIAYNRYAHEVDRLANRYETFMEEFSNILQRQSYSLRKGRVEVARAPAAQD